MTKNLGDDQPAQHCGDLVMKVAIIDGPDQFRYPGQHLHCFASIKLPKEPATDRWLAEVNLKTGWGLHYVKNWWGTYTHEGTDNEDQTVNVIVEHISEHIYEVSLTALTTGIYLSSETPPPKFAFWTGINMILGPASAIFKGEKYGPYYYTRWGFAKASRLNFTLRTVPPATKPGWRRKE